MNTATALAIGVAALSSSVVVTIINAVINRRKLNVDVSKTKSEVAEVITGASRTMVELYERHATKQEERLARTEAQLTATEAELHRTRTQLVTTSQELERTGRVLKELLPVIREISNGQAVDVLDRLEQLIKENDHDRGVDAGANQHPVVDEI